MKLINWLRNTVIALFKSLVLIVTMIILWTLGVFGLLYGTILLVKGFLSEIWTKGD